MVATKTIGANVAGGAVDSLLGGGVIGAAGATITGSLMGNATAQGIGGYMLGQRLLAGGLGNIFDQFTGGA